MMQKDHIKPMYFFGVPPVVGEKRQGKNRQGKNRGEYIWLACPDCAKTRWVPVRHGEPRYLLCTRCAYKIRAASNIKHQNRGEYYELRLKQGREYYHKHKDDMIFKAQRETLRKRYQFKIKLEALAAYCDGNPKCQCCGEDEIEFLSIDHTNGYQHIFGQYKDKTPRYRSGTALYLWLKKNNFPEGFKVLCMNCNFAIGHFGYCPHQRKQANEAK